MIPNSSAETNALSMGAGSLKRSDTGRPGTRLIPALASIAAVSSSWSAIRIGGVTIADAALVLGLAVCLITSFERRVALRYWMILPAFLSFLLMARDVVVYGHSINGGDLVEGISPFQMMLRVSLSTLGVAVLVTATAAHGRRRVISLIAWWLTGIAISSLVAFAQAYDVISDKIILQQLNSSTRFSGLTSHPNALAQTLVLALPFIYLAFVREDWRVKLMGFAGLVLCVFAIFSTGSRAGLVVGGTVFVTSSLMLAQRTRALKWALPLFIVAIAAALVYGPALISGTRFASDSGSTLSDVDRVQALSDGWALFADHPLVGAGLGVWVGELAPLVIIVSGGFGFVFVYSLFALVPLAKMWVSKYDPIVAACLVSAGSVLVLGLFNNGFTERYTFWPAFIGYAIAMKANRSAVVRPEVQRT